MAIYVVTNYGGGKNYTPIVFSEKSMAKKYMASQVEELAKAAGVEAEWEDKNTAYIRDPDENGNVIQMFSYEKETNFIPKN